MTCSYGDILRFKRFAGQTATNDVGALTVISDAGSGQVVVDNFDADISPQNGKLSTYPSAVLVAGQDK